MINKDEDGVCNNYKPLTYKFNSQKELDTFLVGVKLACGYFGASIRCGKQKKFVAIEQDDE